MKNRRKNGKEKPTKKPNGLPPHLIPGNPGNSGGKPGRSGRPPNTLRAQCATILTEITLPKILAHLKLADPKDGAWRWAHEQVAKLAAIELIPFGASIEDTADGGRKVSIYLPDNGR